MAIGHRGGESTPPLFAPHFQSSSHAHLRDGGKFLPIPISHESPPLIRSTDIPKDI